MVNTVEQTSVPALAQGPGVQASGYFDEIERAAKTTPTFPRFWGFNSSVAMANAGELKRQYEAHQAAVERIGIVDILARLIFASVGTVVFLIIALVWMFSSGEESNLDAGASVNLISLVGVTLIGTGVGFLLGQFAAMRVQYKAVYGETIIVDRSQQLETGRIVVGHTNLKRLGFIARSAQRYFFGPTQEASVSDGMIVLEVDPRSSRPLTEMRVGELYQLPAGRGDLTGNGPSDAYGYIQLVQSAGEMERRMRKKKLNDILAETGYILIVGLGMVLIFLQAQSGFSVDASSLDLTSIPDVVR